MSAGCDAVECLVIGGGLAGAMAGLRLAAAGREVLLVEREPGAHPKVCGEFLSSEAVAYLRAGGVDPAQLGAAQIDRLRVSAGARMVETALPFTAHALSRGVLDEALLARASECGCSVTRGAAVERLDQHEDGWSAHLSDGRTLAARSVFLATGKHDLRGRPRPAGVQRDLVGFKMQWRLAPEQVRALRGAIEVFLFRGGYGGLVQVENDVANLCLVARRSAFREQAGWIGLVLAIRSECSSIDRMLGGADPILRRPLAVSPIPYGYLARSSNGLWRVGDQAAVIPSFTGDGMAIALHSGALASEMFLRGCAADAYQSRLAKQLRMGMGIATATGLAMVSRLGRQIAPAVLPILPVAMRGIARVTRIPGEALLLVSRSA